MNKRRNELDIARIIACLMVVMLHTVASGWYIDSTLTEWKYYNFASTMVRGGVSLFFMISGALFLNRERINLKKFLIHNVTRLFVLFYMWSFLYVLYDQWTSRFCYNTYDFIVAVIRGHYHLWFLSAMTIAYLLIPIIHSCIHERKISLKYLFGLFAVIIVRENLYLIPNEPDILNVFLNKLDYTNIQYVGYMIVGYIISNKNWGKRTRRNCMILYVFITIIATYANRWYSITVNEGIAIGWLYGDFSIVTFSQAVCLFCIFQSYKNSRIKYSLIWEKLSSCTLGVYLLHPAVLTFVINNSVVEDNLSLIGGNLYIFFMVCITSFGITVLLKRIPIINKMV